MAAKHIKCLTLDPMRKNVLKISLWNQCIIKKNAGIFLLQKLTCILIVPIKNRR